jgi:hypothetical protein
MRTTTIATCVLALGVVSATAAAQTPTPRKLQLSFDQDRKVNLAAHGVTVVEILAEWARRCGCYVVNADRLSGAPLAVPIQFEHAGQAEVLASLLRQAAGYVLTPSRSATSASNYETIYIVAGGVPPSAVQSYAAPIVAAVPPPTPGAPDDEIPPITPDRQAPPPQPPTQNAPPKPAAPGVSVPPTTVTPFGSNPSPQAPAPARGGVVTPPR